jgi:transposase
VRPLEWARLKFIDEAGVNLALTRLYGRAPRGERVVGSVPLNSGKNVTMIGALSCQGLMAMMTVAGATEGEVFRAYVHQVLCPTLYPGDIVVMDNLRAHKVSGIREAREQCAATLLYLPPYSPDLSPIELCWSKLKTALRTVGARTRRRLERAILQASATICEADAMAWFAHCGYQLN